MIKKVIDSEGNISYTIDQDNKNKYTTDDFESKDSVDELYNLVLINKVGGFNYIDYEGYTALCFAILSGVGECDIKDGEETSKFNLIEYMIEYPDIDEDRKADPELICNKGKTPFQYACISMNAIASDVLIEKLDFNNILIGRDSIASADNTLTASSLNNANILKKIFEKVFKPNTSLTYFKNLCYTSDLSNKNNHTNVMHLICMSQCYEAADLIISKDYDFNGTINMKSKSLNDATPIDIALSNNDIGMLAKFTSYTQNFFDDLDSESLHSVLSSSLDTLISLKCYRVLNSNNNNFLKSDILKIFDAIYSGKLILSNNGIKDWPYSSDDADFISDMYKEDADDYNITKWLPTDLNNRPEQ